MDPSQQVRAKKADRLRIVKMQPTVPAPAAGAERAAAPRRQA